jgi:putative membrane protein insertion efficiency factor
VTVASANPPSEEESKTGFSPGASTIRFYQKYISDLRFGHCRFGPSCSQYGIEAIESRGFFKGTVLTADRLVRCNASAAHYYKRNSGGRLADPVGGPAAVRRSPEVPRWLLPVPNDPPFPIRAVEAQPLSLDLMQTKSVSDLLEYAAFADALTAQGDCARAETEYKRVSFLANVEEVDRWALMKTGNCYYRGKRWDESAHPFVDAASLSTTDADKNVAYFMAAASYFNDGRYAESSSILERCEFGGSDVPGQREDAPGADPHEARGGAQELGADKVQFLRGLCSMVSGDWEASAVRFANIATDYPDSPNRNQALYLQWKAEEGAASVPQKHPNLAAGLSAVIPGLGQAYSGRYFDGFRHFVIDGLLIITVYQLFKEEHYAAGYLVAGFTLPFYIGNVVGAKRSAESYNASKRAGYVSQVIEGAGAE